MKDGGSCKKQASGVRGKGAAAFKTSLGWAGVAITAKGVFRIVLPEEGKRAVEKELGSAETFKPSAPDTIKKTVTLLRKYFSGERVSFDLPLDISHYTRFQQAVWRAVAGVPYGETRSYAWIAKSIGKPRAARAVGQAMGANPIPIMIP